jgi:5-formyltetrahydrofolate cyclo-ligase
MTQGEVRGEIAEKRRIRALVRERRNARDDAAADRARDGLTAQLIALATARSARAVSCYLPVNNEPDTRPFIAFAREHDIEVLLPAARNDGLLDWVRDAGLGTLPGAFDIPEPLGERLSPIAVGEVDLMLVPACAVDLSGTRLGWGRGYFDRNLGSMENRPPVFAVIHDDELFDALPRELHDVPVTGAVTPERVVYLGR